ncbi:MAG: YitT family protein [Erysipelotrichaceae bacterium]
MKVKNILKDVISVSIGTFILVLAVRYFILPFNILSGGVAGVAVAVGKLINIPSDIIINFLIISLFILGAIFLGKQFIVKSVISSMLYPIFLAILMQFPYEINIDPFLASLYSGILAGVGIGIVFRADGSTGGMDIPPLIINKYTHIPVSKLVMVVDACTVLLGFFSYGIEAVLIGLISVYATSITLNKVLMLGGSDSISLQIISKKYEEINQKLLIELNRGTTIIEARGGYTNDNAKVILCVVQKNEYHSIFKIIDQIDKEAFVIVSDVTEVKGEGFSFDFKV